MARVVLLTFDRLHAGYLGCYGNDWIETPHLDSLAAEGVVFDEAFADELAPTLAGESWWRLPDANNAEDVCEVLRDGGVRAICLYESDPIDSSRRLPRCDELVPIPVDDAEGRAEAETAWGRFGEAAARWIGEHGLPDDCLLWLHSRGIPEPWYPPAEYQDLYFPEFGLADDNDVLDDRKENELTTDERTKDERQEDAEGENDRADESHEADGDEIAAADDTPDPPVPGTPELHELEPDEELHRRLARALYAACATAVDRMVGRTVSALRQTGVWDDCLFVVTAARGQALGEHGPIGIDPDLPHSEMTHVPLIVRGPNQDWPGTRRRELVQPADLREFVLDHLLRGGRSPSRMSRVLGDSVTTGPGTVDETTMRAMTGWRDHGWMIRDRDAAYLCSSPIPDQPDAAGARLYALPADRHEFADILGQATEDARRLWEELRSRAARGTLESGQGTPRPQIGTTST
jgi:arylsulfatase A-like enzyme